RTYRKEIQEHLNFTIPEECEHASNGWIFRRLLSQLGIKVATRFKGARGEQVKLYRIEREHWDFLKGIVERRQLRREEAIASETVSTPLELGFIQNGVDTREDLKADQPKLVEGAVVRWGDRVGEWAIESLGTATAIVKQLGAATTSWLADLADLMLTTEAASASPILRDVY
ncbi:MAG: hypothetical protein AAFY15_16535, partial [Cyanobacteria bacterium J06648_11]